MTNPYDDFDKSFNKLTHWLSDRYRTWELQLENKTGLNWEISFPPIQWNAKQEHNLNSQELQVIKLWLRLKYREWLVFYLYILNVFLVPGAVDLTARGGAAATSPHTHAPLVGEGEESFFHFLLKILIKIYL